MDSSPLVSLCLHVLDELKAQNIVVLDTHELTPIMDSMIVASGTSERHNRAIAQTLLEKSKAAGFPALGIEGLEDSTWILIDLNEVVIHVMNEEIRNFYQIEKLWHTTS